MVDHTRLEQTNLQKIGMSNLNIEALRKVQNVVYGAFLATPDLEEYLFSLETEHDDSKLLELLHILFADLTSDKISKPITEVTAVNYTTNGNQTIICTAILTITLNPTPDDGEIATIIRDTSAGLVTISAALISGSTTYVLITDFETARCVYSASRKAWYVS